MMVSSISSIHHRPVLHGGDPLCLSETASCRSSRDDRQTLLNVHHKGPPCSSHSFLPPLTTSSSHRLDLPLRVFLSSPPSLSRPLPLSHVSPSLSLPHVTSYPSPHLQLHQWLRFIPSLRLPLPRGNPHPLAVDALHPHSALHHLHRHLCRHTLYRLHDLPSGCPLLPRHLGHLPACRLLLSPSHAAHLAVTLHAQLSSLPLTPAAHHQLPSRSPLRRTSSFQHASSSPVLLASCTLRQRLRR